MGTSEEEEEKNNSVFAANEKNKIGIFARRKIFTNFIQKENKKYLLINK